MTPQEIGRRLKQLREERGQSKMFVARKLGMPYSTYCSYEYGIRSPNDRAKIQIAEHFGLTVGELFFAE